VYPGGQIGTGAAVLGGDPRSTVGVGSEAAELGGSAGGTEITSARTAIDPTQAQTRARAPIADMDEARLDGQRVLEVGMLER